MFESFYQDGDNGIEIFSSSGKLPGKGWKISSTIHRVYDRTIKGFVYLLDKPLSSNMIIPENNNNTLSIKQRYFIIQLRYNNLKSFTFEIIILDSNKQRYRLHISSNFKEIEIKVFHIQIPFQLEYKENYWYNYIIDLKMICENYFHIQYKSIDSISIQPSCRIRKIFTLPSLNLSPNFICPTTFDFPTGTLVHTQIIPENNIEVSENLIPKKSHHNEEKEIKEIKEINEEKEEKEEVRNNRLDQGKNIKSALTNIHKKTSNRTKNKGLNEKNISLDQDQKDEKSIPNIETIPTLIDIRDDNTDNNNNDNNNSKDHDEHDDNDLIELLNPVKLESYSRPKTPTRSAPKSPIYNNINNLQQNQPSNLPIPIQPPSRPTTQQNPNNSNNIPIPISTSIPLDIDFNSSSLSPSSSSLSLSLPRPSTQQNKYNDMINSVPLPIPSSVIPTRPSTQQNLHSEIIPKSRPSTASRPNTQQNQQSLSQLQSQLSELSRPTTQQNQTYLQRPSSSSSSPSPSPSSISLSSMSRPNTQQNNFYKRDPLNDNTLQLQQKFTLEEVDQEIESVRNILDELERSYIAEYGQLEYLKIK